MIHLNRKLSSSSNSNIKELSFTLNKTETFWAHWNLSLLIEAKWCTYVSVKFGQNQNIFIDKFAFESVVCQSGDHLIPASKC